MRRSSALILLVVLAVCAKSLCAQSRPRRVEQSSSPAATSPPTTGRAPVLSGATPANQGQNPSQPSSTHTGPEEVDQNDVVRVNTTLVTIPVSVMDRDGR